MSTDLVTMLVYVASAWIPEIKFAVIFTQTIENCAST